MTQIVRTSDGRKTHLFAVRRLCCATNRTAAATGTEIDVIATPNPDAYDTRTDLLNTLAEAGVKPRDLCAKCFPVAIRKAYIEHLATVTA